MSHEAGYKISQHPKLRRLQLAQIALDKIEDPWEQETIARQLLTRLNKGDIVGDTLTLDTAIAFASSPDLETKKRLVFDGGLVLQGVVVDVDFKNDIRVPVQSLVVEVYSPSILVSEAEFDEPVYFQEVEDIAPHELESTWLPIMAIRACQLEAPRRLC